MSVRVTPGVNGEQPRQPAVMVHGLGGSSLNWTRFAGLMANRLDTVAVDLPGFGWSPPSRDGETSPAAQALAVADVISHGGVVAGGPVHLFGNSMGGAVAVTLAATRPDLVRSLVLISPALPALRPRRSNVGLPLMAIPGVATLIQRRMRALSPEQRLQNLVNLCYGDPSSLTSAERAAAINEVIRRRTQPYADDELLRSLRALMKAYLDPGPGRLWALAKRVRVPTLIIYGEKDKLVDGPLGARQARAFNDARVVLLPDSGHVPQIEHPELVAQLVTEHLDSLD